MYRLRTLCILVYFCCANNSHAHSFAFSTSYEKSNDDDQTFASTLDYLSQRSDLLYGYTSESESQWGLGAVFKSKHFSSSSLSNKFHKIAIQGQKKISQRLLFTADLGVDSEQNLDSQITAPNGSASISHWLQAEILHYELTIAKEHAAEALRGKASSGSLPRYNEVAFNSLWMPIEKNRIQPALKYKQVSDGNSRIEYKLQYMYGIAPGTPWIWAGLGFSGMKNSTESDLYWSPRSYFSFGLRMDLNVPLNGQISAFMGSSIDRISENSNQGYGHYTSFGLESGDRNLSKFRIQWTLNDSLQKGSRWHSSNIELSALFNF